MCNLPRLKAAILALVPLLLIAVALPLKAQSISGVIAGTIRDQQNQPLPGATVTVANRETGGTYQASSDENGHYRVPEISPGSYDVTVQFPGMQTVKHTEVPVDVDEVTLEDFALKVAGQQTSVQVKSTAPTTDTTDATLRYDFSTAQIQNLPILTRDINNLALLAPGTVSVRTFSFASTLVPFSSNGSRGRDNNFIIDSVDNNEPLFGGAATQFTNTDVFAEFTVLTHQEDAEFGRNSGATVNVITKSGSNQIHGSAFWFGQDGEFNALNRAEKTALLTSPPTSYENQAGMTLGGPIKKDRSFYFISYQWDLAHDDLTRVFPVLSTLPDAAGLSTLKSMTTTPTLAAYLATPSVSTVQGEGGSCFTAPAPSGFNASNPCLPAQPPVDGVTYNVFNVPHANIFDVRDQEASGRFDQKIGNRNDVYARYLFDDLLTPDVPLSTSGDTAFSDLGLLPDARMLTRQRTQSAVLDHRFYGVKYLNELRFAYSRIAQGIGPYDEPLNVRNAQPALTVEDLFSSTGFGPYSNNFPSAGNRFTVGQSSSPSTFHSNIYQIQENFSLIHGRNNFKFGGDFVRTDSGLASLPSNLGQYVFGVLGSSCDVANASPTACTGSSPCTANPQWCGMSSSLNGSASLASVTFQRVTRGSGELSLRTYDEAVFFQDTVQLRPSLSIDAGLRYEIYGQPINDLHTLYPSYVPAVNSFKKNFGPRFGFAWAPSEHVVVRGGYGIQYNPVIFDIALSMWQSGPISPLVVTTSPAAAASIGQQPTIAQPLAGTAFPSAPLTTAVLSMGVKSCGPDANGSTPALGVTIAGSVPVGNCSSEFTAAPTLRNPYVQNYSFGVQWEFHPTWLAELAFVGSKGTQLFLRQDENPLGGWATDASGQPTNSTLCPSLAVNNVGCLNPRANPASGDITEVTNAGDSTYNSLQASLTKRYDRTRAGDFTFTAGYTWSHMIDNASEIFGPSVQFLSAYVGANAVQNDFLSSFYLSPQAQGLQSIEAITPFAENASNLKAEKASSSFDRRQRIASSYLWEPFPTKGIALRGWQLNGIVSYQSGQPFSPLNGTPTGLCADANGDGILTNDRPSIGNPSAPIGSVALLTSPGCAIPAGGLTVADYSIDPANAHFVQVPLGLKPGEAFSVGSEQYKAENAGRNILIGPNLVEWDAALMKSFTFGESKVLQFRWEVYDALNHANAGFTIGNVFAANAQPTPAYAFSPSRTPASVTGVIPENAIDASLLTGTTRKSSFLTTQFMNTSARTMQFGVKFTF
jgi:hypothetical protein